MATMASPPPLSEIVSKHDEDLRGIEKKIIARKLRLVRVDLMQRLRKSTRDGIQNSPLARECAAPPLVEK
jgi:hypothetical protein